MIEHACGSHGSASGSGHGARRDIYARAGVDEDSLAGALPAPTGEVCEIAFAERDLGTLRAAIARWAHDHELGGVPAEELVLAVNELATNSIRYGGGRGTLRMWRDGGELMCEVSDGGRIVDPLAGRVRPAPDRRSGRGLWIVNQLCDLVQMRSSAAGTAIRVHKQLDG